MNINQPEESYGINNTVNQWPHSYTSKIQFPSSAL